MIADTATLTAFLAVLCGGFVGFALALTGGGGSTLAVPLLLYVVGIHDPHLAIGTSALAVSVNAYANLIPHARAGHVRWRAGAVFAAAGVVGAIVGSELGKLVGGQQLIALFAGLMIVVALLMLHRGNGPEQPTDGNGVTYLNTRLTGTGMGAGTLAGFFGVGGGFVIVPGLMVAARMDMIYAIGTSLFGVGSFGLATALNYARSGLVNWVVAAQFILGGVAGGWLGTLVAARLSHARGALNLVFSGLIMAVAVYMLVRTLAPV